MNDPKSPEAIPIFRATSDAADATLEDVEKANKRDLKEACNDFLFKWVPPSMTIAEFEQVSCGLFCRIAEEWENRKPEGGR